MTMAGMAAWRVARPSTGRLAVALLAAACTTTLVLPHAVAFRTKAARPRVEGVALAAVTLLGDAAPAAVVDALADGRSLARVVRAIEAGTLEAPETAEPSTETPTTAPPAGAASGAPNPVVEIDERGIDPPRVVVDPSRPLIVANTGAKVHVVEFRGTGLEKYSLEPDHVGVYELEGLAPGDYTLRCIVAGHEERARLTVPGATPAGFQGTRASAFAVAAGRRSPAPLTEDDYIGRFAIFGGIVSTMAEGGDRALEEGAKMRTAAGRAQTKLEAKAADPTTADAERLVTRAGARGQDPALVLLTNGILLAASNGYDADQITRFVVEDLLDPHFDTGQGLLRKRDIFVAGGVLLGQVPRGKRVDVFKQDPVIEDAKPGTGDEAADGDGAVAGRYSGELTGELLDQLLAFYPGGSTPLRNRIEIAVSDTGVMRFTLELVVPAAWVSNDDNVSCDSRRSFFAVVTPPHPRAELQEDGTFESERFTAASRQTDFTGPRCAEFPYDGSNDQEIPGMYLTGTVKGDTVRGEIPFESEGVTTSLEFEAERS
jgi:hypothetical protein